MNGSPPSPEPRPPRVIVPTGTRFGYIYLLLDNHKHVWEPHVIERVRADLRKADKDLASLEAPSGIACSPDPSPHELDVDDLPPGDWHCEEYFAFAHPLTTSRSLVAVPHVVDGQVVGFTMGLAIKAAVNSGDSAAVTKLKDEIVTAALESASLRLCSGTLDAPSNSAKVSNDQVVLRVRALANVVEQLATLLTNQLRKESPSRSPTHTRPSEVEAVADESKHVSQRVTVHGDIVGYDDTSLELSIEKDGDALVKMSPEGRFAGTVSTAFSKAQMHELCSWALANMKAQER